MNNNPNTDKDDAMLDDLFAASRSEFSSTAGEMDPALAARIVDQADEVQAQFEANQLLNAGKRARAEAPSQNWFASLFAAGWSMTVGLTACAALGLWFGYADPSGLTSQSASYLGLSYAVDEVSDDIFTSFDDLELEVGT
jgi:hypothetical protein